MKTVLVVDDEQSMAFALKVGLAGAGYHVVTAETGEEAMLIVSSNRPDAIVLDLMMPGIGGLETLKLLRMHPEFKRLPVILMSGARPLVKQADYQWNDFLYKPFQVSDRVAALEKSF